MRKILSKFEDLMWLESQYCESTTFAKIINIVKEIQQFMAKFGVKIGKNARKRGFLSEKQQNDSFLPYFQ